MAEKKQLFVLMRARTSNYVTHEMVVVYRFAKNEEEALKSLGGTFDNDEKIVFPEKAPAWFKAEKWRKNRQESWAEWSCGGHISIKVEFYLEPIGKTYIP